MRTVRLVAIGALVAGLVACSGTTIRTDYAPQADFTKYKTYAWHPQGNDLPDDPRYNNSLIDDRIVKAIEAALYNKGLSKASVDSADLLVVYHGVVDQKTSSNTVNSHYGWSPYWGGYGAWGGWGGSSTYVNQYDEGTLIVDLLENAPGDEDRIVWRGMATATVKDANNPSADDSGLRRDVNKMFEDYPPGGSK